VVVHVLLVITVETLPARLAHEYFCASQCVSAFRNNTISSFSLGLQFRTGLQLSTGVPVFSKTVPCLGILAKRHD